MEIEKKIRLLEGISQCVPANGAGEDEDNLLQNFLPLRSYSKLADQRIFLITGGRGSGKTELFRILTSCGGLDHVISQKDRRRYTNLGKSIFLTAYAARGPEAKTFPTSNVCDDLLKYEKPDNLNSFWGGLLCSVILQKFQNEEGIRQLADQYFAPAVKENLEKNSSEISGWWKAVDAEKEKWESFLDKADSYFKEKDLCVFLAYDELDRVCGNYEDLFVFIRSLLDFWYRHNSRYTNLKAKIFLRSDLYNAKALGFVDASKMGAYRFELNWNTTALYQLLVKRLANLGIGELVSYLKDVPELLRAEENQALGYMPGDSEQAFEAFAVKLIGRYMGNNAKRGASYTWVPNHIQDANGEMAPRAFLKCFAFAAEDTLYHRDDLPKLESDRLLLPTRLQGAIAKVSRDRVQELTEEEYQWMKNLIRLLDKKTMLMSQEEFLSYLTPENWPDEERNKLPGKTGMEILDALLTLGIFMKTTDGRINVPEIHLHGFGLKRKGGIRRPK
ncbi:MAG: hypothetical protein HFH48_09675 [Lachnospiraceae bacterium]|nr:hypothetical protein [Lachnospiraceae bacterium]